MSTTGFLIEIVLGRYKVKPTEVTSVFCLFVCFSISVLSNYKFFMSNGFQLNGSVASLFHEFSFKILLRKYKHHHNETRFIVTVI